MREESGLECLSLRLRGTISWPGFGKQGEDWFGFIFIIERWSGVPSDGNAEGTLEWVEVSKVLTCRSGRATGISCRSCSATMPGSFMASCRIRPGGRELEFSVG